MKIYFEVIFCVVTYKNTEDIKEFIQSVKNLDFSYKIIIVNNYCDEESKKIIESIAKNNGCDFINSKNNGYGAGNNIAIRYALEEYDFNYLVVTNPDIIIRSFKINNIPNIDGVFAPRISTFSGKQQNPMCLYDSKLYNYLVFNGFKRGNKFILYIGIVFNKIIRILVSRYKKFSRKAFYKIYMAHGSFVVFPYKIVAEIKVMYDEKMFLFAEESFLAWKLKKMGIRTYYTECIQVLHKEDGSMRFRNDLDTQLSKANLYFYSSYYFNK
jgi:GT2 family glycosyltransferase